VIVPNVSWGLFSYELDLVVLNNNSFYAYEVEIKVSRGDIKRDLLKRHGHDSYKNGNAIKDLYFAIPEKLKNCVELIPERAGVLVVDTEGKVTKLRNPVSNKAAHKWSLEQAFKLARLGTLRIPGLKLKLFRAQEELKSLRKDKLPVCKWDWYYGASGAVDHYWMGCSNQHIGIPESEFKHYKQCPRCGGIIEKSKNLIKREERKNENNN
jgi:hypothetical protein